MNFQIMQQVAGREFVPAIHQRTKEPLVYPCPKMAARVASRLTRLRGIKFQPRPIIEAAWKAREAARFADGNYKPVVWAGQPWWDKHHNPDHFAHVDGDDQTKIAFIENDKDGSADITTAMKPGKYLARFFGHVLTPDQIKAFSMQHSLMFENKGLMYATTPEDIQRVYETRLGGSCFSGTTKANLYGSGDFAIAYIETNGTVTARAVCCPERKIYYRSYGDESRINKLLDDAGYIRQRYGTDKPWSGLRVLKKWHWPNFYTDWNSHGTTLVQHPTDDQYLVIK